MNFSVKIVGSFPFVWVLRNVLLEWGQVFCYFSSNYLSVLSGRVRVSFWLNYFGI